MAQRSTNAFQFQTNHLGLKGDVLVSGGNRNYRTDRNSSWDAIWYVESKVYGDFFLTELKIPFNQLYFSNDSKKWRFNMYRSDTYGQEHSVWSKVPQNQSIGNLAFMGNLIFEKNEHKRFIIVCSSDLAQTKGGKCPLKEKDGLKKPAYLIEWSRFGQIQKYRFSGNDWIRQ